jgi:hypothetical protein
VNKTIQESNAITEYVVWGAVVICSMGAFPDVINMPNSHGISLSGGKPQLNIADCKAGENIKCFGFCGATKSMCDPKIFPLWLNFKYPKLKIEGKTAFTKDAFLVCFKGGVIKNYR